MDTMLYGKDSLTTAEIKAALNSKELQKNGESREESAGEGLVARGRPEKRDFKSKNRARSKSRTKKCFLCHKGHFKRDCP